MIDHVIQTSLYKLNHFSSCQVFVLRAAPSSGGKAEMHVSCAMAINLLHCSIGTLSLFLAGCGHTSHPQQKLSYKELSE